MNIDTSKLTKSTSLKSDQNTQKKIPINMSVSNFANDGKLESTLDGLAAIGTSSIKKSNSKLVDETIEIFDGYESKIMDNEFDFTPDKMVLTHMTDDFPTNGEILCARSFGKTADGLSKPRTSVHFTVNNISPMLTGDPDWADKKFGIIVPMDKILQANDSKKLLGGVPDDFMMSGDVKLPKGSIIVKYNPDIPQAKLKISEPTNLDGIKIIETNNANMNEVIPSVIKKMGFSTVKTDFYNEEKMKNWQMFLDKYNLNVCLHQNSPWGCAEVLVDYIAMLGAGENLWHYSIDEKTYDCLTQEFDLKSYFSNNGEKYDMDYKKCFLDVIKQVKQEIPKDKLSYDIDKLSKIIEDSETPSDAMDKIKSELKLIPMKSEEELSEVIPFFTFAFICEKCANILTEQGRKKILNHLCVG